RVLTATSLLAITVGGLAVAYGTLRAVLARVQVVQTLVKALVARETIARTRLGTVLIGLAARYRLLSREQLVAHATAMRATRGMTLWQGALAGVSGALKGLLTGIGNVLKGVGRFIASPLGGTLAFIAGGFFLINKAVRENQAIVKPAYDAFKEALDAVKTAATQLWQRFDELTGISTFL